jgi:hypothetical protein
MLLDPLVTNVLRKLDDTMNEVWARAEIGIYARDGYDDFARRTKCIFDVVVLENTPPVGGVGSDLQRYLAERTPDGATVSDRRIHFTQPGERDTLNAPIAGVDAIPINATDASQATGRMNVGRLPEGTLAVFRVAWDRGTLDHETPQSLRQRDPLFETRDGDPSSWLWGEDGLLGLRIWPAASGDASYDTYDGLWGLENYTDDSAVVEDPASDGWGIPYDEGEFPSGGLWGFPGRLHPDLKNIVIEIARLGRDPQAYDFEIPRVFLKAIGFYAMSKALKRDGPGQDLKLSQHFLDRYELAVAQMEKRLRGPQAEKRGAIGGVALGSPFGSMQIGLPSWWGYVRKV